ncbi:profilin [Xylaria nigripes]|nr:profilin [Xylaria nigripes]
MSWQGNHSLSSRTPKEHSLVGSGHIDKAAIVSIAGDSIWAISAGYNIQLPELKVVSSILADDPAAKEKAFEEGIHIGGERYVLTRVEDRSLYVRHGRTGIFITKTTQAFIIAHHGEGQVAGNASSTVEALGEYLVKLGY